MSAAAGIIEAAVLDLSGVVRMTGTHAPDQGAVVTAVHVGVADEAAYRCSAGMPIQDAGENFHLIRFPAGRGRGIPAGCAPGHEAGDVVFIDGCAGGNSVDDDADSRSVGFAENSEAKVLAKITPHG